VKNQTFGIVVVVIFGVKDNRDVPHSEDNKEVEKGVCDEGDLERRTHSKKDNQK
jgi:hypothetical protein